MPAARSALLPRVLLLASIATASGYAASVLHQDPVGLAARLPDDAFYYVGIARWRAMLGVFSFDGGQTTTTGFHLLWMYVLLPLASWAGDRHGLLLASATGLSAGVALGAAAVAATRAWRQGSAPAIGAMAVATCSYAFLNGAVSGMEWPLCVALGATGFALVAAETVPRPARWLGLVSIGVLGSLARSDFGGVPFALVFAAVVCGAWKGEWRWLKPTLALAMGAAFGLGLVTAHTHALSHEWLSGSARVKAEWGRAAGWSPVPVLHQFARSLLYVPALHVADKAALKADLVRFANVAGAVLLVVGTPVALMSRGRLKAAWKRVRPSSRTTATQRFLGLAAGATVLFYLVLYGANPVGIQSWYTAHVFVPIAILLWLGLDGLERRGLAALGRAACTALVALNLTLFTLTAPAYHDQVFAVAQGRAVAERQTDGSIEGRVGWSDAGIAGFFQGGTLVNIDGLVNDDVAAYLPDRLPCYLLDARIRYATSFGAAPEALLPIPPWSTFSTPRIIVGDDGTEVFLHEVDFDRVAALDVCARHQPE